MSDQYKAAAYWSSRPESAAQCAKRAATFFRLMGECHPGFARWYEQHNSIRKALRLGFEPTAETFTRFFGMKKNQIFDDGFTFSTWTGRLAKDQGSMVMFRCGSDALVIPNWLQLYLPPPTRVEPVGERGTLVTLTPERLTASNPEHVALARRTQQVLEEHRLLRPILERPQV